MKEEKIYRKIAPPLFSLALSLDCGQAFRWEEDEDGIFSGVIGKKQYRLKQEDNKILLYGGSEKDFTEVLTRYLDLDRDYESITQGYLKDAHLKSAIDEFPGIRILRQEPWETICSFIISQNNNIPRIKGIIKRLCEAFGEPIAEDAYAFPTPEQLAPLSVADLAPLRAGFRAKYILDAAQKIVRREVDLNAIEQNDLDFGREELQKIKGVGKKVAECALLYGFGKIDAFPQDVWVNRILEELYPDGLPSCTAGTRGIAQQYLFHWRRNGKEFLEDASK